MGMTEGFYIDNDVSAVLKMSCKKRGDKSKIVNDALKQYLNMVYPADNQNKTEEPQKIIIESV